jgi:hypothetical protein
MRIILVQEVRTHVARIGPDKIGKRKTRRDTLFIKMEVRIWLYSTGQHSKELDRK